MSPNPPIDGYLYNRHQSIQISKALPEPDLDALLKDAPFVLMRPSKEKPRGPVLFEKIVEAVSWGPKFFHQYFSSTLTRATST